jgi:hypothetical protein
MIGVKTLSVPRLRMFALASAAAVMLGLSAAFPASAAAMYSLPTRKQVCYQDPGLGKVCQWVWEWPGAILPY